MGELGAAKIRWSQRCVPFITRPMYGKTLSDKVYLLALAAMFRRIRMLYGVYGHVS